MEVVLKAYPLAVRNALSGNVFITGGCTNIPGIKDRIYAELRASCPMDAPVNVYQVGLALSIPVCKSRPSFPANTRVGNMSPGTTCGTRILPGAERNSCHTYTLLYFLCISLLCCAPYTQAGDPVLDAWRGASAWATAVDLPTVSMTRALYHEHGAAVPLVEHVHSNRFFTPL